MRLLQKNNLYFYLCLLLLMSLQSRIQALPEAVDLTVKDDLLSVNLQDVSIQDLLNKLKTAKGIWFKAEPSQLGEKVSANFQNLPLERGLRRILSSQDYCLYFDAVGKVVGITLIKKDQFEVQRGIKYSPPAPLLIIPTTPTLAPSSSGPSYTSQPNPTILEPPAAPKFRLIGSSMSIRVSKNPNKLLPPPLVPDKPASPTAEEESD